MSLIDLALAKRHLRLDVDFVEEDEIIGLYLAAAQDAAEQFLGRKLYAEGAALPADDPNGLVMPASVKAAILLTLGHLYGNREDVVIGTIATDMPNGAQALLWPYRTDIGV